MFKFLIFLWRPALPSPSLTTTSAASVPQHIPRSHTTAHAAYLHTNTLMLSPCYPLLMRGSISLRYYSAFKSFLVSFFTTKPTKSGSCWCAGPLHLTLICLVVVQHPGDLPGFLIDGELFGVRAILCLCLEHPVITGACPEVYKFNSKKRKLLGFKAEQLYKICSCIWNRYLVIHRRPDKAGSFQARTVSIFRLRDNQVGFFFLL